MGRSRSISPAVLLIALLAAILPRVLVPSGWMPVAGVDGVRIEICTGSGATTMIMDRGGGLHREGEAPAPRPRDPCPFGIGMAPALDLPAVAALPLASAALARPAAPILFAARLVAWRNLRPPARGPPAFA